MKRGLDGCTRWDRLVNPPAHAVARLLTPRWPGRIRRHLTARIDLIAGYLEAFGDIGDHPDDSLD